MTFVRNIEKTVTEYACFSFHVGLLFQLFVFRNNYQHYRFKVDAFLKTQCNYRPTVADRSLAVTYLSFCHLTYILIIFCGFMMVVL